MASSLNRTPEEERSALLIKYRKLTVEKIEREGNRALIYLKKKGNKYIIMCLSDIPTVGIAFVRELVALGEKEERKELIMVGSGRYTYSAKKGAREMGVEMIPSSLPAFDLFQHKSLIPKHEILEEEDREAIIQKYHVEPYQFPWIKSTDPISIILGARPGDILKITRDSRTAGTYISYRYVIQ
jgi:DNA-directed RNA polymerase subunit H (RpoH/RPB5)